MQLRDESGWGDGWYDAEGYWCLTCIAQVHAASMGHQCTQAQAAIAHPAGAAKLIMQGLKGVTRIQGACNVSWLLYVAACASLSKSCPSLVCCSLHQLLLRSNNMGFR